MLMLWLNRFICNEIYEFVIHFLLFYLWLLAITIPDTQYPIFTIFILIFIMSSPTKNNIRLRTKSYQNPNNVYTFRTYNYK